MEYLDTFILSMLNGSFMEEFKSALTFYRYSSRSFLYILAENCTDVLR
jgi:hypothetical protein